MPWLPTMVDTGRAARQLGSFKKRLKKNHVCQSFSTPDNLRAAVVADLGRESIKRQLQHADRRGTQSGWSVHEFQYGGLEGLGPSDNPLASEDWVSLRDGLYGQSRDVFISHVLSPSATPGQLFDVLITLTRHGAGDMGDVYGAEFFLGKYWGNQVFPVRNTGDGRPIGIWISAYGPSLCVCRVTFTDGYQATISRYLDFGLTT